MPHTIKNLYCAMRGLIAILTGMQKHPEATCYLDGILAVCYEIPLTWLSGVHILRVRHYTAFNEICSPHLVTVRCCLQILLVTEAGQVLEGTQTNFFVVKDDKLCTAQEGVLMGTVRGVVLQVIFCTLWCCYT